MIRVMPVFDARVSRVDGSVGFPFGRTSERQNARG